jgi:hypothetical protein
MNLLLKHKLMQVYGELININMFPQTGWTS